MGTHQKPAMNAIAQRDAVRLARQMQTRRDWRLAFLHFFSVSYPLRLSLLYITLICGSGLCAVILEQRNCKEADLQLWLMFTMARMVIRLSLRVYLLDERPPPYQKVLELLDFFGIIWFAVGNLLIFNNTQCSHAMPITFATILVNIGSTYLIVCTPVFMKACLTRWPPHRLDAPVVVAVPPEDQTERWTQWLSGHGCTPQAGEGVCSICLLALSQKSDEEAQEVAEVVCYPCSARHQFHTKCLTGWLQVCFTRSGNESGLTCPCCRQHPQATVATQDVVVVDALPPDPTVV